MKNFITAVVAKYLLVIATAAVASTGGFLVWTHGHAADGILSNKSHISLIQAVHKNHVDIALKQERLRSLDLNRTQVVIAQHPDRPDLVELKNSLDRQIATVESELQVLRQTESELEQRQLELK